MTTRLRTKLTAVLTTAALLAGCGTAASSTAGSSVPPTAAETSPSPTTSDAAAALEAVWRSPVLSRADVVASLRAAGLQRHARAVLRDVTTPEVYSLSFASGTYSLTRGALESVDSGRYELVGTRLRMVPHCSGCSADFTITLDGDTLRLALVHDSSPPVGGVPDAAFLTALYESAAFTRA